MSRMTARRLLTPTLALLAMLAAAGCGAAGAPSASSPAAGGIGAGAGASGGRGTSGGDEAAITTGSASGNLVEFKTPSAPAFLLIDHGAVWVAAHRGGTLYELDPRTNRIVRTVQTNDDICDLAPAHGYILIGSGCVAGSNRLFDPRTGKFLTTADSNMLPVLWGGSAWKWASGEVLERLDSKTHVLLRTFSVRSPEGPIVEDAGSLWIPGDAWVTRIVLATNVETVIPLPGGRASPGPGQGYAVASHLAVTPGKIWIGNPAGIYWINGTTNKATLVPKTVIGNLSEWGNIAIYAARGSVFARTGPNTITRIDPQTDTVTSQYRAAGGGGDVAVGYGSLWVTNFGTDTTWREPL
jgi:hypothetical protein